MEFTSGQEKREAFHKELKQLLAKFDAELTVQNFGDLWSGDERMVVEFKWDEKLFISVGTGNTEALDLGRFEDGSED